MLVMSLNCIFQLVFEIPSHRYDVLIIRGFCCGVGVQILKLDILIFLLFKLKFNIKYNLLLCTPVYVSEHFFFKKPLLNRLSYW